MNTPEKTLAANLIRLLKQQQAREGVTAYFHQEVKLPDGTCPDLVIHRTETPDLQDIIAIYQCKMVLNDTLLEQCIASQDWADMVVAVVPAGVVAKSPINMASKFNASGIGITSVGSHALKTEHWPRALPGHTEILKYLNAHNGEGGTFAAAGSQSDRRATKENIIAQAVEKYVSDNPGCRFVDVRRAVPALPKGYANFEAMVRRQKYRVRIEIGVRPCAIFPLEATNV